MLPLLSTAVLNSILNSELEKEKRIPGEIGDVDIIMTKDRLLAWTTDPAPNILLQLICQMFTGS